MTYNIDNLENQDNERVIFRGVVGSRAYGTNTPDSDTDIRGIFVVPSIEYAYLSQPPNQVSDKRNDRTYYSLRRFCELASNANPTAIEMLYLPEDCILTSSLAYSILRNKRRMFLTGKIIDSYIGYAMSQIKKARGTNKRVWNPWPENPPIPDDYCSLLDDVKGVTTPVSKSNVNLMNCKVRRLLGNGSSNIFALYDYQEPTGGVFRGGMIYESKVEDLHLDKRVGLLIYNEQSFNNAKRQHQEYWEWRKHRNESRWIAQERGEMDYDTKNMMHLVRLLLVGENIVKNGEPIIRFEGEELELLLSIKRGELSFDEIMSYAESKMADLKSNRSGLPSDCDMREVDGLILSIMKEMKIS